ncbi:uncharacterized protein FIBRA_02463 [Fibroporia radiculosa]|uniref:Virilizer N-terminal domain-containing protein n=1 Tax=Fibroporia radiculosa TaxID=599839 RepID=J4I927_9APHY|nr:uncharacterized protein FIBRA_02463 [Fibroporia radiculosa]CCM00431.1 predicted protein [Fibroporia radiculosa]
MLLHWCTLEPSGVGNLAAIRFSSPVRVQSIRIFPTGAQPFAQHPEIISRTDPQAFYLELYFNAYRVVQPKSREKPKPTNALVPTVIAYAGGKSDFYVLMGSEYATRLMIVRGGYESVSMAIYGDIISELSPPPTTYEPRQIPSFEPIPLSRSLDPSNSLDPCTLARQLLCLIPDAPSLPLAIRLVFCLKPPSDDWDLPEFPYLHPDLDSETSNFDLEQAFRLTTRPVPDDVADDTLIRFAQNVASSIRAKDSSQSYLVAGILAHAASQHPSMSRHLLDKLDLSKVFDSYNMDELTLLRMHDAATNPDIARYLDNDWFLEIVGTIARDPNSDKETQSAAHKLIRRIRGWITLEDVLSNTQGDFISACEMLKDIGTDEQSLGVWLESMITHDNIANMLSENPIMPIPLPHPPYLFGLLKSSVSHDEFIAFLRAAVGVSAVLAVYAFADAYPHKLCRERALSIIRLWQGVDGYREIVNHLLLLKQMTFRLECMMDNDPPRRAGLDAEHILVNLAKDPHAILHYDLIKCILSLRPPHSFITDDERESMRQAAIVADDGLPGAIDELMRPVDHPLTLTNLRTLRVALAVIDQELDEQREFQVLQDFWEEGSVGLIMRLVDVFVPLSEEIKGQFGLRLPEHKPQELLYQLFCAADELLKLSLRLIPAYPLPGRAIATLTTSVADLFVCTDAVDMLYSQSSPTCVTAQGTRQTCIDIVRTLSDPEVPSEGGKLGAEVVLKTLLQSGLHSEDLDPVHHLLQVFCLVDFLLPMPGAGNRLPSVWIQRVMPLLLKELWAFCSVLDTENKAHFIKRLINLDRGLVGVGEWLLHEELKGLLRALQFLEDPAVELRERGLRHFQVSMSLHFWLDLARSSFISAKTCIDFLTTAQESPQTFSACLVLLLNQHFVSPALTELVEVLASEHSKMDSGLRASLALILIRASQSLETQADSVPNLLHECFALLSHSPADSLADGLRSELGPLFSRLQGDTHSISTVTAELCVQLLEWLASSSNYAHSMTLQGLTRSSYSAFLDQLRAVLDPSWAERLGALESRIVIAEEAETDLHSVSIPDFVKLTMHDVEELLRSNMPPPSTPPRKALNQDVLGLVAISPPALIRSPASTGLTKTYNKNDFRQLRQAPSARQNTSRLPSMHVDEFEGAPSPSLVTVPMPMQTAAMPFPADNFQSLAPPFNPL